MSAETRYMIAEIDAAIQNGTLTHSEIEGRLVQLIDIETEKTDSIADMELIRACEDLLWELNTRGKQPYESNIEQMLPEFRNKLKSLTKQNVIRKYASRVVTIAAAIILLVFGLDALLHHEWLVGGSTDDEEQYVISGQKVDPGLIDKGRADDSLTEPQSITTANIDEAVAVLGFEPAMPQWLPDGWELDSYYASNLETVDRFIATYVRSEQEYYLIYQVAYYDDAEKAGAIFEQNKQGESITLSNGKTVYMSSNYADLTCIWYEDIACYNLMGPENLSTFTQMILNIKENTANEIIE